MTTSDQPKRVVIMGAAGRDFHNFNMVYRDDPASEVVAFTAAQIPNISDRRYPPELSGPLYPKGVPIFAEEELAELVTRLEVRQVVFSYSDVSYVDVMHRAAIANAAGADFVLLGPRSTTLESRRPVIAVKTAPKNPERMMTARKASGLTPPRAPGGWPAAAE